MWGSYGEIEEKGTIEEVTVYRAGNAVKTGAPAQAFISRTGENAENHRKGHTLRRSDGKQLLEEGDIPGTFLISENR
jgi:hypothetical protein